MISFFLWDERRIPWRHHGGFTVRVIARDVGTVPLVFVLGNFLHQIQDLKKRRFWLKNECIVNLQPRILGAKQNSCWIIIESSCKKYCMKEISFTTWMTWTPWILISRSTPFPTPIDDQAWRSPSRALEQVTWQILIDAQRKRTWIFRNVLGIDGCRSGPKKQCDPVEKVPAENQQKKLPFNLPQDIGKINFCCSQEIEDVNPQARK